MRSSIPLIVFSDLDGTLLDHESYSWAAARPALSRLAALEVPVILATSKTAAETTIIQQAMGLSAYPAIVENGAGLVGLASSAPALPDTYSRLRSTLDQVPQGLRTAFTGFGDMSAEDVAGVTGLSLAEAERAKARVFSEPGLWAGTPSEREAFIAELAKYGISARAGGRFLTLSFGKTKKDRMAEVADHYGADQIVALGDAPNDVEMLEAADLGIIVLNPHNPPLPSLKREGAGKIIRSRDAGPAGWNTEINAFLDAHDLTKKDTKVG